MSISLKDLLMLVGRLDDGAGFDTPRERLRRFLAERVTEPSHIASILDECQRLIGEQPHRVLQDTVVMLGRFLGFEPTFGTYQGVAGAVKFDGQWRSRARLHVVLEIRSDQTRTADLESLERSLAALAALGPLGPLGPMTAAHPDTGNSLGLCVMARHYPGRIKLENSTNGEPRHPDIRLVSVQSLVWLAEAVATERLRHEDVLKLLKSGVDLDFVVELLQRVAYVTVPKETVGRPEEEEPEPEDSGFWATTITRSDSAAPEQLLTSLIGQRRILGVTDAGPRGGASPGDWVCLFVPLKGIVGHAQLATIIERTAGVVRHSEQYSRVFGLDNLELYEDPIVPGAAMKDAFAPAENGSGAAGPTLVPIARADFMALTRWREPASLVVDSVQSADGVDALLT
jgi:hypothetical protein